MTHEDMLFEIDHDITYANGLSLPGLRALRAVIELHKPGNGEASRCEACYLGFDCPTIQAILAVI